MKLNEIQELIKFVAKAGVSEVELQSKDFKIVIKTTANGKNGNGKTYETPVVVQTAAPVVQAIPQIVQTQAAPPAETKGQDSKKENSGGTDESNYVTIKSPMIGTFYRSSGPDKPAFVNVGDEIKAGKVICIIEAMKLFNEIEADVTGRIVKVLANDTTPIEYDQPLFLIDPS